VYQKVDTSKVQPQKFDEDVKFDEINEEEPYVPPIIKDDGLTWKERGWKRDYDFLTDQDRLTMLVDETFALYLSKISQKTNPSFYKTVMAFVILFRECLNEIGWQKRIESEQIDLGRKPEIAEQMRSR